MGDFLSTFNLNIFSGLNGGKLQKTGISKKLTPKIPQKQEIPKTLAKNYPKPDFQKTLTQTTPKIKISKIQKSSTSPKLLISCTQN